MTDEPDARVAPGALLDDARRLVGARVVDDDDLERARLERLREEIVEQGADVGRFVVGGDPDADVDAPLGGAGPLGQKRLTFSRPAPRKISVT